MLQRSAATPMDLDYLRPRFWTGVAVGGPDACWPWARSVGSHGYGQTWDGITVRLAHRAAYALTYGPIPDGLTVDHLCRRPRCCNPAHLRLLTNLDNATDNASANTTTCRKGLHPWPALAVTRGTKGTRECGGCWEARHGRRHPQLRR